MFSRSASKRRPERTLNRSGVSGSWRVPVRWDWWWGGKWWEVRTGSAEQLIQVCIGGGGVADATSLFRGSRIQGSCRPCVECRRRGAIREFRDAEVEQPRLAVGRHQNIAELEVAMNDQVAVLVRNGIADFTKQLREDQPVNAPR
jgi:hypothetical protein